MNNNFHNNSDIFVRNFQIHFKPCESKGVIWVPIGLTYCDVRGNGSFIVREYRATMAEENLIGC